MMTEKDMLFEKGYSNLRVGNQLTFSLDNVT